MKITKQKLFLPSNTKNQLRIIQKHILLGFLHFLVYESVINMDCITALTHQGYINIQVLKEGLMNAESSLKILYVEDEADIREITRIALSDIGGHDLCVCCSGLEAIQKA